MSALFHQSARTHQNATRSTSYRGIRVPQVRTELGKKAFAFIGTVRWNGPPACIRASRSNDISSSHQISPANLLYLTTCHLLFTLLVYASMTILHSLFYMDKFNPIVINAWLFYSLYLFIPSPRPLFLLFYCLCLYCSGCLVK